ncbi:MAG: acyl-CoA dehydrogenase family protein [Micropepsaceae bacterium]
MFTFSEEQRILKESAREFMRHKCPVDRFRKMRDEKKNGRDPELWRSMAELGWTGILVPEVYGGSELGVASLGLVLEETGRTLASSPLLSTSMIGASALMLGGGDALQKAWLPKIANGEAIMALAIDESSHHAPERVAVSARKSGGGYALSGTKRYVPDGHLADLLIVSARTSGTIEDTTGITLFLVNADAKGVSREELITVDSRGAADFHFDDAGAEPIGVFDRGAVLLEQLLDRARVGLAAEMLGQAQESFEQTTEYLKTRRQFGQVIGGFQALQHRAAKMFTDIELTRSCVLAALDALDKDAQNSAEWASLAKARACETLHLVSNETVQMFGGIGMTDAHDAGLFLKRARVAEGLYGGESYHRDRYARHLGF